MSRMLSTSVCPIVLTPDLLFKMKSTSKIYLIAETLCGVSPHLYSGFSRTNIDIINKQKAKRCEKNRKEIENIQDFLVQFEDE